MNPNLEPTLGRALSIGLSLVFKTPGALILGFATEAIASLLMLAAWSSFALLLTNRFAAFYPCLGAMVCAALLGGAFRFWGRCGIARLFQAAIEPRSDRPGPLVASVQGAARALRVAPLLLVAWVGLELLLASLIGAGIVNGLARPPGTLAFVRFGPIAFAGGVALMMGWLGRSILWLAVLRAIRGARSGPLALAEAWAGFLRRSGAFAVTALAFGIAGSVLGSQIAAFDLVVHGLWAVPGETPTASLLIVVVAGALQALATALIAGAELGTWSALDAGQSFKVTTVAPSPPSRSEPARDPTT